MDRKKDLWPESTENRKLLSAVVEAGLHPAAPRPRSLPLAIHRRVGSTRIEGLAADGAPGSALVLDTADLRNTGEPPQEPEATA
jgi:hypothetical protein